jgi:hypothetical protein
VTDALREAVILPAAFLTVVLLGSVRIAEATSLVPPSVFALVLGLLVVRVAVQSGALAPQRLLGASRSTLANVNGLVVLLALWLASAQVIAVLIPESGLPRIGFGVFLLILLLNTAAASPDRIRLLRSLAVAFGALFLLKFVVLRELSAPGTGSLKRMLQTLLEGITLGVLLQPPSHPAASYVALLSLLLFLVSLFLLPARTATRPGALVRRHQESIEQPARTSSREDLG